MPWPRMNEMDSWTMFIGAWLRGDESGLSAAGISVADGITAPFTKEDTPHYRLSTSSGNSASGSGVYSRWYTLNR